MLPSNTPTKKVLLHRLPRDSEEDRNFVDPSELGGGGRIGMATLPNREDHLAPDAWDPGARNRGRGLPLSRCKNSGPIRAARSPCASRPCKELEARSVGEETRC